MNNDDNNNNIRVEQKVRTVLQWPTDTVEIDYLSAEGKEECPHTILVFFPGNPGLIGWYIPSLWNLVKRGGPGFAARGISYAGHGSSDAVARVEHWMEEPTTSNQPQQRTVDVPFTVDGQILHKEAYMDMLDRDTTQRHPQRQKPRYIFLAHSIGCHMIQRLLVLRPDLLQRTDLVLHITPFTRMKSDKWSEFLLFHLSSMPETIIGHAQSLMKLLAALPVHVLDTVLKGDIACANGRKITVDLLQQPHFGRNFFELGMEEVRDLPEVPDVNALRLIGQHCPIGILFVHQDKWAPKFHMHDLQTLQAQGVVPNSIFVTFLPQLVHDYVVRPAMVPPVDDFCWHAIQTHVINARTPQSRL